VKKTKLSIRKTVVNGVTYWQITMPKLGGGRLRRTFKDRREAQTVFDQARVQHANHGTAALSISDQLRSEAVEAARELEPYGIGLLEVVREYTAKMEALKKSRNVKDAVDDYIDGAKSDGRSRRYLNDLRYRLGRFSNDFPEASLSAISTSDLDSWLRGLDLGPASRNAFRRRLSALFSYALARDWCVSNPVTRVQKAREHEAPIGILTPEELAQLLSVANPETLPYWAIGAFAGLRSAELERLEWKDVRFETELIEVSARKSKTASRRLVKIEPALLAWLEPYRREQGLVVPQSHRKLLLEDRPRAGLMKWPPNALRHSFASYHLAHFGNAAKLALELGHTNADLIFRHYREVVTPTEAAKWWNVMPATGSNVVSMTMAASV
jgi:integrase